MNMYDKKIFDLESEIEMLRSSNGELQKRIAQAAANSARDKANFLSGLQQFLNKLYRELAEAQKQILAHIQGCNEAVVANNIESMERAVDTVDGKRRIAGSFRNQELVGLPMVPGLSTGDD
jgi:CRISPR/Cas system CMR subunit Cmr6 (Cas7 group RAMP superfamily)